MRSVGQSVVDLEIAGVAAAFDRRPGETIQGPACERRIFAIASEFATAPKRITFATLGLMRANASDLSTALAAAADHFGKALKPSTQKKVVSEARALLAYGVVDETPLLALSADGAPLDAIFRAVSRAGLQAATEARARCLNGAGGGRRRRYDKLEPEIQVKRFPTAVVAADESAPDGAQSFSCESLQSLGRVRVTGEICIEIEAGSFAQAAAEQERLERVMRIIQEQFPKASLKVRERRRPRGLPSQVAPGELHVDRSLARPRSTT